MRVVALVTDLMDQSRIRAALDDVVFVRSVDDVLARSDLDTVDSLIVDLRRCADVATDIGALRASAPEAYIVGFGPHVDDATLAAGRSGGADVVLPRSRFFRDVRNMGLRPATGE